MGYIKTLTPQQQKNLAYITGVLAENGITNPYTLAAILCILSKESGFEPKYENDYRNTSVARIREVFPGIFGTASKPKVSDAVINDLKANPVKWFNYLYNGKNGNRAGTNDGYTYRGGGLNQLTFRNTYEKAGKSIGVDLINQPTKINELKVAALVVEWYYESSYEIAGAEFKKHYGAADINAFTDIKTAVTACYHINAGLGRTFEYIQNDHFGGLAKSLSRGDEFFEYVKNRTFTATKK